MNNPFDYTPSPECDLAFRRLLRMIDDLKKSQVSADIDFCRELDSGKMLGVLIAKDAEGTNHTLYAFSGQIGDQGFHRDGFVGPVFDYLQPNGYFKTKEADISRLNVEISDYENGPYAEAEEKFRLAKDDTESVIAAYKEKCRLSKEKRDRIRSAGPVNEAQLAAMLRQSQFEKAELHRLKKRLAVELSPLQTDLDSARVHLDSLKEKRRSESEALQQWLFSNFRLLNARGDTMSLGEIFADTPFRIPPSGAGECCAPKLLHAAYLKGWIPLYIAEYWYGAPKGGDIRRHGEHYPACRGKCRPVLGWMLQGLDVNPPLDGDKASAAICEPRIIFENDWFCVIEKPSGMLSVPGKRTILSVQQWLQKKFGEERNVKMAHRLDQDTSGLIIAAFGDRSYRAFQTLFATRGVAKTYVAVLDGDYRSHDLPESGRISLPLSPDWLDRPRQRVDLDSGKDAITDFEFLEVIDGRSRIVFRPLTGRTHQLRVHAASDRGLGMPIVGDPLYGLRHSMSKYPCVSTPLNVDCGPNEVKTISRLLLHAHRLEFTFPLDGSHYCFESKIPF